QDPGGILTGARAEGRACVLRGGTMRFRLLSALAAVSAIIALVVTSQAPFAQGELPMAKAESVGMSTKRLERVHAYIQEYIDSNMIAGAVTLIARKGKVVHYEAQGWRYKEDTQPMQKDSIFELM